MSAGFGFSVGDIVAFLKLIKQSIEALQDTKGSTADFQGLSHDIDSLKDGLEAVADLKLEQRLGVKSKQSSNWKANLKKIKWALCKKEDVNRFQTQLERHCSSISLLLVTLQVSQSFEQSAQQENQQQVALESHSKGLDLHLNQATALLVGLTLDQRQLFQSVLENNQRMTHELHEMRGAVQLQLELPPQVILQKPVTLLDACGEVSAFYLDFINCAEAFLAVLKIRFQRLGVEERGVRMLDDSKFVLEDFRGRLDLTKPWSQIMRPSQKIDMSMIFHRGLPWSVCPACQKENQVDFESGTECEQCGLFYRRVQEPILRSSETGPEVIRGTPIPSDPDDKLRRLELYSDEDLFNQFRRVQLVYTYLPSEVESKSFEEACDAEFGRTKTQPSQAFATLIGFLGGLNLQDVAARASKEPLNSDYYDYNTASRNLSKLNGTTQPLHVHDMDGMHDRKRRSNIQPSQADATLIGFLGGLNLQDVAARAGKEPLKSNDER